MMGIGPARHAEGAGADGLTIDHMDVIELNEAFAAQGLAVLRALGLKDDDARVNAWGGAIALEPPAGCQRRAPVDHAVNRLHRTRASTRCAPCALAWARHCLDPRARVTVASARLVPSSPVPATALAARLPKPCWPRATPWSIWTTCAWSHPQVTSYQGDLTDETSTRERAPRLRPSTTSRPW